MIGVRYASLEILEADVRELSLRLKMPTGAELPILEKCISEVRDAVSCKACIAEFDVRVSERTVFIGDDFSVESANLAKNLSGCTKVEIMAVTLGAGVDMLLRKKGAVSASEHFVCDAVASAFAERAADLAEKYFMGDTPRRPRFSPGYGDLPLEIQRDVLRKCDAGRLLGINLTESDLMIPTKSITAMIGKCE